ncbi:uncharacterized protein [Typha latifolia]|uniref:uncharacterized protein n=1 Tax=Typha latifolia TaxID=4733 RepID=UPI003C2F9AE6
MGREVAECCVDGMVAELVSAFSTRFYVTNPEIAAGRIYAIGFQVGQKLSERYTIEHSQFTDHIEAIKFICQEFWFVLFKKQIDSLRTNLRGTFVLQDNNFQWLTFMPSNPTLEDMDASQHESSPTPDSKIAQTACLHLCFPCGIIQGALSNLGIRCAVSADISNLPACSFVLHIEA